MIILRKYLDTNNEKDVNTIYVHNVEIRQPYIKCIPVEIISITPKLSHPELQHKNGHSFLRLFHI